MSVMSRPGDGADPHVERRAYRRALVSSGWLLVGEFCARGIAFFAVALLTRRLGPEGFGIVGFATAVAGYLAIAVHNGVGELGARELAAAPDNQRLYGAVTWIRLALGAVAWCVVILIGVFLPRPLEARVVVGLTGIAFVAAALDPSWALKARERAATVVVLLLAAQVSYALGVYLFVREPIDVFLVPILQFGPELLVAVVALRLTVGRAIPQCEWRLGASFLWRARFLTGSRLMRGLIVNFDTLMLGYVAAPAQLGIYAACYRLLFLLMAIGGAISTAFLPALARASGAVDEGMHRASAAALSVALIVAMPTAVGGALVAPELLTLLFGPGFAPGAAALRLLMLAGGCFIIHSTLGNVFLASDRTSTLLRIHAFTAIVNVLLNLWLIPVYGIVGAAGATLAAEGITAIAQTALIARRLAIPRRLPLVVGLSTAVMACAVSALAQAGLPLRIGIGVGLYASTLLALSGFDVKVWRRSLEQNGRQ